MKINKSLVLAFFAVVMIMSLTSCNRGVGCPSDFSILKPFALLFGLS